MRQFLRIVERDWWCERIEECEITCNSDRMYKILKEIGRMAPPSVGITVEEFNPLLPNVPQRERLAEIFISI